MYRVIIASTGTWLGGKPWDKDRFEENAEVRGLEIFHDDTSRGIGDYIILDKDTIFYHATWPKHVNLILQQGLKAYDHEGLQAKGVYLTGGRTDLDTWVGKDTCVLEVLVKKGTRVYRDFQPNAVYIRENVPPNRIQIAR